MEFVCGVHSIEKGHLANSTAISLFRNNVLVSLNNPQDSEEDSLHSEQILQCTFGFNAFPATELLVTAFIIVRFFLV